ncbi:hypothetical protein CL633_01090 [bacterium]|nr:hypothetical protein [bacterium]
MYKNKTLIKFLGFGIFAIMSFFIIETCFAITDIEIDSTIIPPTKYIAQEKDFAKFKIDIINKKGDIGYDYVRYLEPSEPNGVVIQGLCGNRRVERYLNTDNTKDINSFIISLSKGEYCLLIYDSGADTLEELILEQPSIFVKLSNPPISKLDIDPSSAKAGITSVLLDGSDSYDPDIGDEIIKYEWDFGDGTPVQESDSAMTNHVYASPGNYLVDLTVYDSVGLSSFVEKNVQVKYQTGFINGYGDYFFECSKARAKTNESQECRTYLLAYKTLDDFFSVVGVQTKLLYVNNNNALLDQRRTLQMGDVEFIFIPTETGSMMVRAVFEGDENYYGTAITSEFEVIENYKPRPNFSYLPLEPNINQEIQFNSSVFDPDDQIWTYAWDFGDGSTSTEDNPKHSFSQAENYLVKLTVTDKSGAIGKVEKTITTQDFKGHNSILNFIASPNKGTANNMQNVDFASNVVSSGKDMNGNDLTQESVNYTFDCGDGEIYAFKNCKAGDCKTQNKTIYISNFGQETINIQADDLCDYSKKEQGEYSAKISITRGQDVNSPEQETIITIIEESLPECELILDPVSILKGESANLCWTTKNAEKLVINNGINNVSPVNSGCEIVSPKKITTYTGTAEGPGGEIECTVDLEVREQGDPGINPPNQPTNLSPDNATGVNLTPTLSWQGKGDPEEDPVQEFAVVYKNNNYIARCNTNPSIYYKNDVPKNQQCSISDIEKLDGNTDYKWKVIANDLGPNSGGSTESDWAYFTTGDSGEPKPNTCSAIYQKEWDVFDWDIYGLCDLDPKPAQNCYASYSSQYSSSLYQCAEGSGMHSDPSNLPEFPEPRCSSTDLSGQIAVQGKGRCLITDYPPPPGKEYLEPTGETGALGFHWIECQNNELTCAETPHAVRYQCNLSENYPQYSGQKCNPNWKITDNCVEIIENNCDYNKHAEAGVYVEYPTGFSKCKYSDEPAPSYDDCSTSDGASCRCIVNQVHVDLTTSPNFAYFELKNAELIASIKEYQNSALGPINYYFDCNINDLNGDCTENLETRKNCDYVLENTYDESVGTGNICNYNIPGQYTAKVLVERGLDSNADKAEILVVEPYVCSPDQPWGIENRKCDDVSCNFGLRSQRFPLRSGYINIEAINVQLDYLPELEDRINFPFKAYAKTDNAVQEQDSDVQFRIGRYIKLNNPSDDWEDRGTYFIIQGDNERSYEKYTLSLPADINNDDIVDWKIGSNELWISVEDMVGRYPVLSVDIFECPGLDVFDPIIKEFDVAPIEIVQNEDKNPIVSWTVFDLDENLDRIEIWRAKTQTGECTGDIWGSSAFETISAKSKKEWSDSFIDTDLANNTDLNPGAYCYGLHVYDKFDKTQTETQAGFSPIKIILIEKPNTAPSIPIKISPSHKAKEQNPNTLLFSWEASEDDQSNPLYKLYLTENKNDWPSEYLCQTIELDNKKGKCTINLKYSTKYYWNLIACDIYGKCSHETGSEYWEFTTIDKPTEPGVCGDNIVNQINEECDGKDDNACPGQCDTDTCTCLQTIVPKFIPTWQEILPKF